MFSFLFTVFAWFSVCYVIFLIVQLVRVFLNDCDLVLSIYERWGKRPEQVFAGKVVWITGASSGIGEAIAYELAKAGAKLILSARGKDDLERVARKCKELSPAVTGDAHMVLVLDLLNTKQHGPLTTQAIDQYGHIDVLINNAGSSQRAIIVDTQLEVDRAILELNTIGTVSLTKCVLPHMLERGSGSLAVISSIAGIIPSPGSASYSVSKHALQGFFNTLRLEIANKGVSVHTVCPGPIATPFANRHFGSVLGKSPDMSKGSEKVDTTRMKVDRCAQLIVVALANGLDEVWISRNPILFFAYIFKYSPILANWLGKKVGGKRAQATKEGKMVIDNSFFSFKKKKAE